MSSVGMDSETWAKQSNLSKVSFCLSSYVRVLNLICSCIFSSGESYSSVTMKYTEEDVYRYLILQCDFFSILVVQLVGPPDHPQKILVVQLIDPPDHHHTILVVQLVGPPDHPHTILVVDLISPPDHPQTIWVVQLVGPALFPYLISGTSLHPHTTFGLR